MFTSEWILLEMKVWTRRHLFVLIMKTVRESGNVLVFIFVFDWK